ncbi:exodeoxyribonuclease VII large subunit [Helicobacter sp. 11S03491-1]|uniref:exodeoxyribonuclease VII large subunit n=1 Tax=Helicobacter sp. 11S03491-1 TaxID=1476196 RepID=UPI000BA6905E|nr:exodeoxyribonuclease VII large subunit [Helicobacter sp. 11S03491-1]PAF43901.1 exodeoxyribonuclease VII large subunit [Helicobacter sp. 11S03491-1]
MDSRIVSVSEVNSQIKSLMETTFLNISVEGEISNLTKHTSGHIYFSLKDENSAIKCVMFKGNTSSLKFDLQRGQKIVVHGGLSVYIPRGEYQIICKNIQPSGIGALSLAYDQLKKKLQDKGYFDKDNKKELPLFPKKIALLTSSTGAALQDMLRVGTNRWGLVKMVVINTLVQGEGAKDDIVKNIQYADSFYGSPEAFDIIVIARGGGSMEDLWAFNEEILADAIFKAKTPIVSAIGHEVDFVISDFVADLRAPTPSACMEMILPDREEWLMRLDEIENLLYSQMQNIFYQKQHHLKILHDGLKQVSYEAKFEKNIHEILELKNYLNKSFQNILYAKSQTLSSLHFDSVMEYFFLIKIKLLKELQLLIEGKNPKNFISSGYAQILHEGKISPLSSLQKDDVIELIDTNIQLNAQIL